MSAVCLSVVLVCLIGMVAVELLYRIFKFDRELAYAIHGGLGIVGGINLLFFLGVIIHSFIEKTI